MTQDKSQELLNEWEKIKDDQSKVFFFKRDLSDYLETELQEECGTGQKELTEDQIAYLNAYKKLFNFDVDWEFKTSWSCDMSEIRQEEECSRDQLIDYLKGEDIPQEPDPQDALCDGELDIWVEQVGEIEPQCLITNFELKEIYSTSTPKNSVAPIQETKKFKLVLEIEDNSSDNDLSSYAVGVKDYLNFAGNGYKVVTAKVDD